MGITEKAEGQFTEHRHRVGLDEQQERMETGTVVQDRRRGPALETGYTRSRGISQAQRPDTY